MLQIDVIDADPVVSNQHLTRGRHRIRALDRLQDLGPPARAISDRQHGVTPRPHPGWPADHRSV